MSDYQEVEFKEITASKRSINSRKLVCGVGINDANYITNQIIDGSRLVCPYYNRWTIMINRCYSNKFKAIQQTYKECEVCQEWITFSKFKKWMKMQNWNGKELDKDIIKPGNKVYSPENCAFVNGNLNKILNLQKDKRGMYSLGVTIVKRNNKYHSRVRRNGNQISLGVFSTQAEASDAYLKEKVKIILKESELQDDLRVSKGLVNHAVMLLMCNSLMNREDAIKYCEDNLPRWSEL